MLLGGRKSTICIVRLFSRCVVLCYVADGEVDGWIVWKGRKKEARGFNREWKTYHKRTLSLSVFNFVFALLCFSEFRTDG